MLLTAQNVQDVSKACLLAGSEDTVVVQGIMSDYGFSKTMVAQHEDDIASMLSQLPDEFKADVGGGWSFLNGCLLKDGTQWTGLQVLVEMLVCLGIACGRAEWLLKEYMKVLPGGVPYFIVKK